MAIASCAKMIPFVPTPCAPAPGGIARIGLADATLWDFTQAAPVAGVPQPYTAITDLGTGESINGVQFTRNKARYKVKQKNTDGVAPSYSHTLTFNVPNLDMLTEQWSYLTDVQGYCCGILIFIFLNAGPILIMGESSVNGATMPIPFYTWQDGSEGDSGEKFDDPNTYNVTLTGMYTRPLIQYTGTPASLLSLFIY